jgi:Glyoxalase/Bleomycin resistance protein/Dioxygenase superfamily
MSRLLGPIMHNGYVVRDIAAAMQHWIEVWGVGPWFYIEHLPVTDFQYNGQPSPVELSIALANSGLLLVELIQQRNDAPSMYRDFLNAGHEGLQHVGYGTQQFEADPLPRPRRVLSDRPVGARGAALAVRVLAPKSAHGYGRRAVRHEPWAAADLGAHRRSGAHLGWEGPDPDDRTSCLGNGDTRSARNTPAAVCVTTSRWRSRRIHGVRDGRAFDPGGSRRHLLNRIRTLDTILDW